MIQELDLQQASTFGDASCQPEIDITRRRIAGRVVVLCEVRIYVRSAMVERRCSLVGTPQRQLREHVRSPHILNPCFSRDSRLQSGSSRLNAAHN